MYRSLKQWLFAVVKIHKSLRNQNKNLPLLLGCRPGREPLDINHNLYVFTFKIGHFSRSTVKWVLYTFMPIIRYFGYILQGGHFP